MPWLLHACLNSTRQTDRVNGAYQFAARLLEVETDQLQMHATLSVGMLHALAQRTRQRCSWHRHRADTAVLAAVVCT